MQKIKMLKTLPGVPDGQLHPINFVAGEEYEHHQLGDDLIKSFASVGAIEHVSQEEKSEGDAPANKARKAAPENKSKK